MRLLRFFYNLAYPLALILALPWLIRRMVRRGKYRHKFGQRFAIYSRRVRMRLQDGGRTWVHAVSVGEVLIAMKLIRRLRERDPQRRFVLSTTTSTGFALANEQRCDWLEPIYNPLDFFWFTRKALDLIRPDTIVLIEAEVWPNLVCQARYREIPVALVNARLSPRSESRFRTFRIITSPIFNQLDVICVQEPEDVDRWQSLGVAASRIRHTGSIKFDDEASSAREPRDFLPLLAGIGIPSGAPVFLGASTHKDEEAALGRAYLTLKKDFPDLLFISVPRHAERAKEVRADLEALGLRVINRTEIQNPPPEATRPDALLVDSTGELRDWYACATVVFVGKSLLSKGGQNPAEPIVAGRPVVFGPNMQNFAVLVHGLLRAGGAVQISGETELPAAISRLLSDPANRGKLVQNGQSVIASHRGATDRTADILLAL
ncbi:MAG TPA: 3-deoxy-D-manno-octulosonic acid transferase [Chthoniobacterales bacterium]|nr:3-deoxy-D-manno-octulosonic acid transferase [Chthoniobacterales bacterium]